MSATSEEVMREKQINIRLSKEEMARLEKVSRFYGLDAANLFRVLLRAAERHIDKGEPTLRPLSAGVDGSGERKRKAD